MKLNLYWKDKEGMDYNIAILEKEDNIYKLEICENELKNAIRNGCIGIGNITFLQNTYESRELFSFFKNRIPNEKHPNISNILQEYGIEKYDEMELLKATQARLHTDRYYCQYIN